MEERRIEKVPQVFERDSQSVKRRQAILMEAKLRKELVEMEFKLLKHPKRHLEMDAKSRKELVEVSPKQFVDYLCSRKDLSWKSPTTLINLWVFWTEEKPSNHTSTKSDDHTSIQDRIKTALSGTELPMLEDDLLIEFWAAADTMTDEGARHLLTTADQPFALNRLTNEKLNRYKKNRPNYKYVDQGEEEHNLTDGSIGRVFRSQLPEVSSDVSYYSVKEYPERDLALGCGFRSTFTFPVFEPSQPYCCVGVLELLFTEVLSFRINRCVRNLIRALQDAGLQTSDTWKSPFLESSLAMEELNEATAKVCEKHSLTLGNIWSRCEQISSYLSYDYDVNCRGGFLVSTPCFPVEDLYGSRPWIALTQNYNFPQRLGHSLLGKVFPSDKPFFCRDVTQLSIIDYPMAHLLRGSDKLKSCFIVCLQSVATGNRNYAIEFFFPQDKIHSADLHNLLSSILTTLKEHLNFFAVVTGDIRNDFFTEIDNMTVSNVEASMVKEKNVILPEQGNTSFTQNTLNTSSGHKTRSSSSTQTDYKLVSALNTPSVPPSVASAREQISILTSQVQIMQADIEQFERLVDKYEASSCQSMEL